MISRRVVREAKRLAAAILSVSFLSAMPALGVEGAEPAADRGAHAKALEFSSERNDVSSPLRSIPILRAPTSEVREVPDAASRRKPPAAAPQRDTALQSTAPAIGAAMPAPLTNWAGIGVTQFSPPDTNGDVGPNHVVQIVNDQFQVWEKPDVMLPVHSETRNIWIAG